MKAPSPKISKWRRSAGLPCHSRGNQTKGTIRVLPSIKSTIRDSSFTVTCLARGSSVSTAEEFIPALQELVAVILDERRDRVELCPTITPRPLQGYGVQPEFRHPGFPLHVHMRGLVSIKRYKKEPMGADSEYRGHAQAVLSLRMKDFYTAGGVRRKTPLFRAWAS